MASSGTAAYFRHVLPRQELVAVIGKDACAAMDKALGGQEEQGGSRVYALRRTQAQGRWIGWHTDQAWATTTAARAVTWCSPMQTAASRGTSVAQEPFSCTTVDTCME